MQGPLTYGVISTYETVVLAYNSDLAKILQLLYFALQFSRVKGVEMFLGRGQTYDGDKAPVVIEKLRLWMQKGVYRLSECDGSNSRRICSSSVIWTRVSQMLLRVQADAL